MLPNLMNAWSPMQKQTWLHSSTVPNRGLLKAWASFCSFGARWCWFLLCPSCQEGMCDVIADLTVISTNLIKLESCMCNHVQYVQYVQLGERVKRNPCFVLFMLTRNFFTEESHTRSKDWTQGWCIRMLSLLIGSDVRGRNAVNHMIQSAIGYMSIET